MNECMNDAPEDGDEESCRQVGDAEGDSRLVLALVASGDCGSRGYADDPAEYLVSVCYFMACLKNQEQLCAYCLPEYNENLDCLYAEQGVPPDREARGEQAVHFEKSEHGNVLSWDGGQKLEAFCHHKWFNLSNIICTI